MDGKLYTHRRNTMNYLKKLMAKVKLPAGLRGMQPARDWFIMLTLAFLLIIGSVVWNVLFFTSALNDEVAALETTTPVSATQSALPALEAAFAERAQTAARYQGASFVDPSI